MQQINTRYPPIRILQQAVDSYNAIILKQDNFKVDLETSHGTQSFKKYLDHLEQLIGKLGISAQSRQFRDKYTKAYRVLYNDSELGYIPEIFDAAQEGFPYIWVNGEYYIFETSTLEKGEKLIEVYFKLIQLIRMIYLHSFDKNKQICLAYGTQLKERLKEFDKAWIEYEQAYIGELIRIEEDSKKTIIETLEIEKLLTSYENSQRIKGKIFYHKQIQFHTLRRDLCAKLAKLNSVANINGKGRDDLTYDILLAAESVLTKVSDSQSKSIRIVAQKIRQSFGKLREVLKYFSNNIEMVDPQLKNNEPLVEALTDYESNWEKGKKYFLSETKQSQILTFSSILEAAKDKYMRFRDLLQYSDPAVFWMIPSLIVLNSLQGEDEGLAQNFIEEMKSNAKISESFLALKEDYEYWKMQQNDHSRRELYNELEKNLIDETCEVKFKEMVSKIKQFSINLERLNPTDWNDMLSMLLIEQI